jgi:heat-inducible transcriptional repressor
MQTPLVDATGLSPRVSAVLGCVIEQYIATAQPVASAHIARDRAVSVSPATARSVLAQLTELGLLSQPHTSAGRVPTELAFRLYADAVLRRSLEAQESGPELPLAHALEEAAGEVELLLRRAVDLLSEATGQLGFLLGPRPDNLILDRLRLLRLSSERVMAVLVSRRGVVQSRVFDEQATSQRDLERVAERLSELVGGSTLPEARERLHRALEQDRSRSDRLWQKALALGVVSLDHGVESLYLGDKLHLLAQPEFTDVDRLRDLLATIEEKERMVKLLDQILSAEVLGVSIGDEIGDPDIRECALVSAPLGDSPALGGLGVLGPVRMRYDHVIPLVRSLSLVVSRYLS